MSEINNHQPTIIPADQLRAEVKAIYDRYIELTQALDELRDVDLIAIRKQLDGSKVEGEQVDINKLRSMLSQMDKKFVEDFRVRPAYRSTLAMLDDGSDQLADIKEYLTSMAELEENGDTEPGFSTYAEMCEALGRQPQGRYFDSHSGDWRGMSATRMLEEIAKIENGDFDPEMQDGHGEYDALWEAGASFCINLRKIAQQRAAAK